MLCLLLLVLPPITLQDQATRTPVSLKPVTSTVVGGNKGITSATATNTAATIAYCISVTSCGGENEGITEGAAVLAHSIRRQKSQGSRYDAKLYAFVHPSAKCAAEKLEGLGYDVQIRETPINATEIKGEFLRRTIQIRGCCQEKELLKLYAYTLSEPVAVHIDVDFLILKPLDKLFDAIIGGVESSFLDSGEIEFGGTNGQNVTIPSRVDAFFTRDYNLSNRGKKAGMQGGFFVIRPSTEVFEEYKSIILEGDHRRGSGWAGQGHGGYYGAQQIQGLVAHYYDFVRPNTAIELNRCLHNTMADNPRDKKGHCRNGAKECEDCRSRNIDDIFSAHFTICQKPWICPHASPYPRLCAKLHRRWFQARKELEMSRGTFTEKEGKHDPNTFLGYCESPMSRGYIPIQI